MMRATWGWMMRTMPKDAWGLSPTGTLSALSLCLHAYPRTGSGRTSHPVQVGGPGNGGEPRATAGSNDCGSKWSPNPVLDRTGSGR